MSFKEQLRDWLGGQWRDFWNVPIGAVLIFIVTILWILMELFCRLHPGLTYTYTLWPLRILLGFGVIRLLRLIPR